MSHICANACACAPGKHRIYVLYLVSCDQGDEPAAEFSDGPDKTAQEGTLDVSQYMAELRSCSLTFLFGRR